MPPSLASPRISYSSVVFTKPSDARAISQTICITRNTLKELGCAPDTCATRRGDLRTYENMCSR